MTDQDLPYTGERRRKTDASPQELERRIFHLKALYDLGQGLPILRGTEAIVKNLLPMVMGSFGSVAGLAFLVDPASGRLEALAGRGLAGAAAASLCAELVETKRYCSIAWDGLAARQLEVWAPFRLDGEVHGGIALGAKLSGEPYTADDRELLCTLAAQGAVAVENARLLERMKQEEVVRVNLMRYLSPHMVDQIINRNLSVNLGGDHRTVTVLFSDIRDFTALAETRPPEQLVRFLNDYFTSMAACIFEAQGTIDKYIGDAVMAVFGSLIPVENTSLSAVEAAVLMMRLLAARNAEARDSATWFPVEIGIGITTGEVFLGNIGSPERMEYTVIGDTVNVASRFSGLARAGQILVDRATADRLGDCYRRQEHQPVHVKGKAERVEIFEILY